jgi:uncharacterized membrane protein YiaA
MKAIVKVTTFTVFDYEIDLSGRFVSFKVGTYIGMVQTNESKYFLSNKTERKWTQILLLKCLHGNLEVGISSEIPLKHLTVVTLTY